MKKVLAIVTIFLLPVFLVEIISRSTPLFDLFDPALFLYIAILGYGLPVFCIRELVVRKRVSIKGIVFLGMAYAIYNEGLLAQTFTAEVLPIREFEGIALFFGVQVAWLIVISLWHAFASVLFPILIFDYLFPEYKKENFLPSTPTMLLAVGLIIFGIANFVNSGQIEVFVFFMVMILSLVSGSLHHRTLYDPEPYHKSSLFIYALGVIVGLFPLALFHFLPSITTGTFFVVLFIALYILVRILSSGDGLKEKGISFALGLYTQSAIVGAIALHTQGRLGITNILLQIGFVVLAFLYILYLKRNMKSNAVTKEAQSSNL